MLDKEILNEEWKIYYKTRSMWEEQVKKNLDEEEIDHEQDSDSDEEEWDTGDGEVRSKRKKMKFLKSLRKKIVHELCIKSNNDSSEPDDRDSDSVIYQRGFGVSKERAI